MRLLWIGLLLTLAGCSTPSPWQNPNVPKAQWDTDRWQCRDQAERLAGYYPGSYLNPVPGQGPQGPIERYDRQKLGQTIAADEAACMTE